MLVLVHVRARFFHLYLEKNVVLADLRKPLPRDMECSSVQCKMLSYVFCSIGTNPFRKERFFLY